MEVAIAVVASLYRRIRWRIFWSSFQLPEVDISYLAPNVAPVSPLITDKLCLPPYEGPHDHNDALPLFTLVKALNPNVVLELGTGYGATVANICALSDARVWTVNALPEQIEGTLITFALPKEEIGRIYKEAGFAHRVTQIYQNTKRLCITDYLPSRSVDLAIIDACHDSDFVVSDFLCILPALRQGSTVLLHDVHPSLERHLKYPYIASMYLRKLGFDVRHLANTWWGVWRFDWGGPKLSPFWMLVNLLDCIIVRLRGLTPVEDVSYLRRLAEVYL